MFLHEINNDIIISGMLFSGGYQDKYEDGEINQEVDNILGWNQNTQKLKSLRCTLLMK